MELAELCFQFIGSISFQRRRLVDDDDCGHLSSLLLAQEMARENISFSIVARDNPNSVPPASSPTASSPTATPPSTKVGGGVLGRVGCAKSRSHMSTDYEEKVELAGTVQL